VSEDSLDLAGTAPAAVVHEVEKDHSRHVFDAVREEAEVREARTPLPSFP